MFRINRIKAPPKITHTHTHTQYRSSKQIGSRDTDRSSSLSRGDRLATTVYILAGAAAYTTSIAIIAPRSVYIYVCYKIYLSRATAAAAAAAFRSIATPVRYIYIYIEIDIYIYSCMCMFVRGAREGRRSSSARDYETRATDITARRSLAIGARSKRYLWIYIGILYVVGDMRIDSSNCGFTCIYSICIYGRGVETLLRSRIAFVFMNVLGDFLAILINWR